MEFVNVQKIRYWLHSRPCSWCVFLNNSSWQRSSGTAAKAPNMLRYGPLKVSGVSIKVATGLGGTGGGAVRLHY